MLYKQGKRHTDFAFKLGCKNSLVVDAFTVSWRNKKCISFFLFVLISRTLRTIILIKLRGWFLVYFGQRHYGIPSFTLFTFQNYYILNRGSFS